MKKLSNIEESHWSDMNRRSQGILKRKEEDVNILDLEGLHSYIRNTYDYTTPLDIYILPIIPGARKEPELFIALTHCKHEDRSLYYKENNSVFMIYDDVNALNCMDLLSQKYNAFYKRGSKYTKSMVYISPKDNSKKIDNKFFLEVLDYILMNIKNPYLTKKKNVNESHWSEMNRRSQGMAVRKEDDINLMDALTFCDYLNKIYRTESESCIKTYTFNYENEKPIYTIVIDLYANERGFLNQLYYDNKHIDIKQSALKEIGCEKEFNDAFLTKNYTDNYGVNNIEVFPKDGNKKVTNKFVIEVIDFLLDKIDVPLEAQIEKIGDLKESHWSEMNRRSQGTVKRKEDNVNLLDFDQFYKYLNNRYKPCYTNQNINRVTGSLNYIDVPLLCGRTISHLTIYENQQIKSYIWIKDVDLYPEVIDTLNLNYDITIDDVEKGWKTIFIYTKGKRNQDEKHANSFYVQLIDYILDMDKPEQLKNMLERRVNE